jgi:hypothetical protein
VLGAYASPVSDGVGLSYNKPSMFDFGLMPLSFSCMVCASASAVCKRDEQQEEANKKCTSPVNQEVRYSELMTEVDDNEVLQHPAPDAATCLP